MGVGQSRGEQGGSLSYGVLQHGVDVVLGRPLAIAGEVPQGSPDDRAGELVINIRELVLDGLQGGLVEAHLGVGVVAVVKQQQRRCLQAGSLVDNRARASDIDVEDCVLVQGGVEKRSVQAVRTRAVFCLGEDR